MRERLENLIYNNPLFCALLFIPFVEPLYFTQFVLIDTIFFYWKLGAMALIIFLWLLRGKVDKVMGCLAVFLLLDCLVTTVNQGNTAQMYTNAITLLAMAILFKTAAEKGSYQFVRVAAAVFEILILVNLVTIIVYPEGLYNFEKANAHYFLGSRNVMMRTIFPGVCFSMLRSKLETDKLGIRAVFITIAAGLSLVLVWSATALFAYMLFCLFLFLFWKKGTPGWFTVKGCYIFAIVIFVAIVILRLQELFSFIIEGLMQKDTTFTGRTILWDSAMRYIARSPIWGYGLEYLETIGPKLYKFTSYDSSHNLILDVLYQNGVVGFALLSALFVAAARKVDRGLSAKYRTLFTLCVFCYMTMINFEPFINGDMRLIVSMFVFMCYFNEEKVKSKTANIRRIRIKWIG